MRTVLPPRLLTGTVVSGAGRAVGTVIAIATVAVITRSLAQTLGADGGLAAYGAYATVLAIVAIATVIADAGFYLTLTQEVSRDGAEERALLETAWPLRLVSAVGILAVATGVVALLPYPPVVRLGVLVGMVGGLCQLLSQLLMGVFQKRLRLFFPAVAEVLGRIVQLLGAVVVAVRGGSVLAFLGVFVFGTAVTFLLTIIGARRFVPFRLVTFPHWQRVRAFLRATWPMGLSLLLSVTFFKVDSVMLSLLRPAADVALYTLPYKVLESLLFFPAMVGGMLLPVFSRAGSRDPREVSRPLRTAADLYLLGALPLAVILFAAAPWIVVWLGGESFAASAPVLRILAVTLGVLFLGNLFGNAIIALGRQRALLALYAMLTLVNIALNAVVIPRFSYTGAAWTTLITEVLSVVLAGMILLRHHVGILGTANTGKILLSGLVLLGLLFLPLPPLLALVVALAGFALTLLLTGAVRLREIRELMRAQHLHARP